MPINSNTLLQYSHEASVLGIQGSQFKGNSFNSQTPPQPHFFRYPFSMSLQRLQYRSRPCSCIIFHTLFSIYSCTWSCQWQCEHLPGFQFTKQQLEQGSCRLGYSGRITRCTQEDYQLIFWKHVRRSKLKVSWQAQLWFSNQNRVYINMSICLSLPQISKSISFFTFYFLFLVLLGFFALPYCCSDSSSISQSIQIYSSSQTMKLSCSYSSSDNSSDSPSSASVLFNFLQLSFSLSHVSMAQSMAYKTLAQKVPSMQAMVRWVISVSQLSISFILLSLYQRIRSLLISLRLSTNQRIRFWKQMRTMGLKSWAISNTYSMFFWGSGLPSWACRVVFISFFPYCSPRKMPTKFIGSLYSNTWQQFSMGRSDKYPKSFSFSLVVFFKMQEMVFSASVQVCLPVPTTILEKLAQITCRPRFRSLRIRLLNS